MISYAKMPLNSRRELYVFYVLDTSGSMRGLPISTLNRAMGESLLALKQVALKNGNAIIKVAVLEFSSGCQWMQEAGPEEMEDFDWKELEAGGLTFMGAAIRELNSKMTRDEFLRSATGLYVPVIIFMTDGNATDNYEAALAEALKNELFSEAVRIGFAIGDDADFEMIARLTGNPDAVLKTNDLDVFADMLVFVSESASNISRKGGASSSDMAAAAVHRARRALQRQDSSVTLVASVEGPPQSDKNWDSANAHPWEIPEL